MKKLILTALMVCATSVATFGQGAISFKNVGSGANGSVNAPVTDAGGTKLAGANYSAQLYYGAVGAQTGTFVNTGAPVINFSTTPALAGYFASNPTINLTGFAIGTQVQIQFRVWDNRTGATFENAGIIAASAPITVTAGDPFNPSSLPVFAGVSGFALVPEPATFAMLGLGAGALLLIRRRK